MYDRLAAEALFKPWVIVLAGAIVLTLLVELDALPDEAGVIREVQGWAFPGGALSDAVRYVTSTQFVVIAGFVGAVTLRALGERQASVVLVAMLAVSLLLQAGLKELADRPRPSEASDGIVVLASQTSASFPAGHVMGPTVVYGFAVGRALGRIAVTASGRPRPVALALGRAVLLLACSVIALTGVVNVHLGVHYPTDVLGGYLWGLVILLPGLALVRRA